MFLFISIMFFYVFVSKVFVLFWVFLLPSAIPLLKQELLKMVSRVVALIRTPDGLLQNSVQ